MPKIWQEPHNCAIILDIAAHFQNQITKILQMNEL